MQLSPDGWFTCARANSELVRDLVGSDEYQHGKQSSEQPSSDYLTHVVQPELLQETATNAQVQQKFKLVDGCVLPANTPGASVVQVRLKWFCAATQGHCTKPESI